MSSDDDSYWSITMIWAVCVVGILVLVLLTTLWCYCSVDSSYNPEQAPLLPSNTMDIETQRDGSVSREQDKQRTSPSHSRKRVEATNPETIQTSLNQITADFAKGGVFLHTTKGPKQVTMKVTPTELQWYSPITGKKYAISLEEIKYVETGKKSLNFSKKTSSESEDHCCFSLVCQSTTIDVEVPSTAVRDSLVYHFQAIVSADPSNETGAFGF